MHGIYNDRMKCPQCGSRKGQKVIDSRVNVSGANIRRRRTCMECGWRFTTIETLTKEPAFTIDELIENLQGLA